MRKYLVAFGMATSVLACAEDSVIGPDLAAVQAARVSSSDPRVTSTDPDTGFRSTTIEVRVLGSGFDQGSKAMWALDGDTAFAKTHIKTNTTSFVSSKELRANISIGTDAPLDSYDVIVLTTNGKKGIGIELFVVTYEPVDLGVLPGTVVSFAYAVNAGGVIVGEAGSGQGIDSRAVRWVPSGNTWTIEDLESVAAFPPGTTTAVARDVNDAGVVVGLMTVNGVYRAFLLDGTTVIDLGPGGARAVNDANPVQVVGGSGSSAFVWTAADGMQLLPSLGGSSYANDVNANGIIVGTSYIGNVFNAARWEKIGGTWTVTRLPQGDLAGAHAINDAGNAAGIRYYEWSGTSGHIHAYLWPSAGGSLDLGTLGGTDSDALGINSFGDIVGWTSLKSGGQRAFLRRENKMTDLGALVLGKGAYAQAHDINDSGLVVGNSEIKSGSVVHHAAAWTTK